MVEFNAERQNTMSDLNIKSVDVYNRRMATSLIDKIFFLDKVDVRQFIDFGCADGELMAFMATIVDDGTTLIGYDRDPEMIKLAQTKLNKFKNVLFSDNLEMLDLNGKVAESCLILSSVLHEIYHYGTPQDIEEFWNMVYWLNCKNIVIRDMIPSQTIERKSHINDIRSVITHWKITSNLLKDFEDNFGSIESNKNLIHFLLKYQYLEPNWSREVKENYLPIYYENLIKLIPPQYEIIYSNHYVLPYFYRHIKKEFGIVIKDNTHLQLILERK